MKLLACVTAAALSLATISAAEPAPQLGLEKTIPLRGVEGRFDHAAADPAMRRLFLAALGNDTVEVLDIDTGKRLYGIVGLKRPAGVAFRAGEAIAVASGGTAHAAFTTLPPTPRWAT